MDTDTDDSDREDTQASNLLSTLHLMRTVELLQMVDDSDILKRNYTVRERLDPFIEYSEGEFESRYRLSKALVRKLYVLLDGPNLLEPRVSFLFFHLFWYIEI